jgi:hypothetical protein
VNAFTNPLPGEPAFRLGTRPARRIMPEPFPLYAFELIETDRVSWKRDRARMFALCLQRRSIVRPIKAKHDGLMFEAAEAAIRMFLPHLWEIYEARGAILLPSDYIIGQLAKELVEEMQDTFELKSAVMSHLETVREVISANDDVNFGIEVFTNHRSNEEAIDTIVRWIDYIEYRKQAKQYEPFISMHRLLICCMRINDAVFLRQY